MPDYLITLQVRVTGRCPGRGEHEAHQRTPEEALKLAGQELRLSLDAIQNGVDFEGQPSVQEVPTPQEEARALVAASRSANPSNRLVLRCRECWNELPYVRSNYDRTTCPACNGQLLVKEKR